MKVVDFIRKFGWEVAKRTLNHADGCDIIRIQGDFNFPYNDLKTYVDAWELVGSFGGLLCAKIQINTASFLWGEPPFKYAELKKAIQLVEEVCGG